MEQQTVTNTAVIHGLCAMTLNQQCIHCSLRLAPTMINHLTSTFCVMKGIHKDHCAFVCKVRPF